jgi:hypothetical protein
MKLEVVGEKRKTNLIFVYKSCSVNVLAFKRIKWSFRYEKEVGKCDLNANCLQS